MKSYTRGRMGVEEFNSLTEFYNYLASAKPNARFNQLFADYKTNDMTKVENYSFSLTHTYADANDLYMNGYERGIKALIAGGSRLQNNSGGTRNTKVVDFVGGAPHIANAVIGLPKTMIRNVKVEVPQRTVTIYYDCSAHCDVDVYDLEKSGKNIYATIQHLEKQGIRVRLMMFKGTHSNDKIKEIVCLINAKDFNQKVNARLLSYPVCHPSFFRRHLLRWVEVTPLSNNSSFKDHAYTLRNRYRSSFRKYLVDNKVIKLTDYYIDCESCMECNTIDQVLRTMNFKS